MPKVTQKQKEFFVCLKHKEKINSYYHCVYYEYNLRDVLRFLELYFLHEYNIISINFTGYAD